MARPEAKGWGGEFDDKPMKMGCCGAGKWMWTLAMALHIRAAMPNRANQVKEN